MGGGGGGRNLTPEELEQLQQVARRKFREGDQPERRNVFISFAAEDRNEVELLRGQAKNESSHLEFIDHSVKEPINSTRADYIKQRIREKINRASVTLCLVSDSTSHSHWVNWEIRESLKLGKGVIAMYKGQSAPKTLPAALKENNITPIPWNQKAITKAIERSAKNRSS